MEEPIPRVGTPPEYLVNANERQYLAKLCWLLHDAGTHALRTTFDSFHPPLSLRQHLAQAHVRGVLQKLLEQKILTEKQWKILYPPKKQEITSEPYDARLLAVLLQFICHLSPPYPHGWHALPLPQDSSLSADVVRIQMYFQQAGSLGGVRHEEYPVLWKQIVEVLLRMGTPEVRVKIARIDQETLTPEQQTHYISLVKNSWGAPDEGSLGRLRRMGANGRFGRGTGRQQGSKKRNQDKNAADQEGISPEDRAVINKTHRQLCEAVMAEDIVDRLVQGHVINFGDRQEIMTPGKNQERMQILLAKIVHSKLPFAFKVLLDALKFKYPRVYEAVNKVGKVVQREGVTETLDVATMCQEGLATQYRSVFSRVTPLPWSEAQASIRDVYVPLDVVTEDGKKLQLSHVFPPAVTSGRGKRVLIEGESGSGKTYLAAMLTYLWAGQKTYFTNLYNFLIYIDARTLQGPIAKALHAQVLPENVKVSSDELWQTLEANARDTIFIIDGFDEDHSNQELKEVIKGDTLRHATVLLTSRPEARAGKWMKPDHRLYVLGLSSVNVGRCLKSYAVVAQMTSEEYDEFHEVISSPEFEFRVHLGNPYVCLAVFGVYLATGEAGLASVASLTSLFEQFLVAMATNFCRKMDIEVPGSQFPDDMISAIRNLQSLAYRVLVSKGKLLGESDLERVTTRLRAAMEAGKEAESTPLLRAGNGDAGSRDANREEERENSRGGGGKAAAPPPVTDVSLLCKLGVLYSLSNLHNKLTTGGTCSRWSFTCSMVRDFLAARHMADMSVEDLNRNLREQKILRHPRFALVTAFLCGLVRHETDTTVLASLLQDLSIQVVKHSRKITFKETGLANGVTPESEEEENGIGSTIMNFAHTLQALSECTTRPELTGELVKALPKSVFVHSEGLIPVHCFYGLARAIRDPNSHISHFEIDLLPHNNYQSNGLHAVAEALAGNPHLQTLFIRWQSLPLMVNFLRTCLMNAPQLHCVVLDDLSKKPVKQVNAATWAGLQELCALLGNTRTVCFRECQNAHVVSQLVIYLPNTIQNLDFSGSAFNSISAADLGAKLETSQHCASLNLTDTELESADLTALFQDLKLCTSIKDLNLSGTRIDRASAAALSEYIRLTTSLERLDLTSCHVATEACQLLATALLENRSITSIVLTNADIRYEGREILARTKEDEIAYVGLSADEYV